MIALSSGEAKLYAFVLACSVGIGLGHLFEDLGVALKPRISMDATAGTAMAKRQGLGTAKHICTQHYLWLQERIQNQDIELRKVGATENVADLLAKHLTEAPMSYLLGQMGYAVPEDGGFRRGIYHEIDFSGMVSGWRSGC